ncbi:cytochrome c-type biogenesis protein [Vibrio marisflavi]|uniref:Cytochrome c-type biogenesis protein n=1 Tax=Vibrio marisflavi CECT 7928 TaxID=634439 RepID=A0ABM9A6J4_9VIBR|nr:cytochrome c-type biogenesis protein [Vibrio marisflavi]CAH0540753.1 Cytochrome c-type biogenesis protein CcmH [Vibrio marisflavi CECT 7928]
MKKFLMILFATLAFCSVAQAAIEVYDFDNQQQEKQFQELSNTLRCPKCQNNTIADSNAGLAQDLRQKVYVMTKEGKSKAQIVDYMVARYGNFVTYNPPFNWSTAILWIGPGFVLVFGFTVIVLRSRKAKKVTPDSTWDEDKEAKLNELLNKKQHGEDE